MANAVEKLMHAGGRRRIECREAGGRSGAAVIAAVVVASFVPFSSDSAHR